MSKNYVKGSACCVVPGCAMRAGTNLLSQISMYSFPKDLCRRKMWEIAIKRDNWIAKDTSKLCSLHFITGNPSEEKDHPDYVPSIFPQPNNLLNKKNEKIIANFQKNQRLKLDTTLTDIQVERNNLENTNRTISTMTDLTMKDIKNLENINATYTNSNENSSINEIFNNQKKLYFYTHLPNIAFFNYLLNFILSNWKPKCKTFLAPNEQLLLVLMKLRLGLLNVDLAYRFKINAGLAGRIFKEWIHRMAETLSVFIQKPQIHKPQSLDPNPYLEKPTCIIDCSEIFLEKAFKFDARSQTYSNYKHHNTVKFLISCTPSGCITFISKLYGGRISDKEITKQSGFMDTIQNNDIIYADRGFKIDELVALKGAKIRLPASTKNKKQLLGEEITFSRHISKIRINVERIIGRLKSYRILKITWPISLLNAPNNDLCIGDMILIVLSSLCNISKPALNK